MPPIVGVPFFFVCAGGPSSRIDWPICSAVSRRMSQRAEQQRQRERHQRRHQRAEGDVLEDVERRARSRAARRGAWKSIRRSPAARGARSTASSAAPRDPFSRTRSPARHGGAQTLARFGVVGGHDRRVPRGRPAASAAVPHQAGVRPDGDERGRGRPPRRRPDRARSCAASVWSPSSRISPSTATPARGRAGGERLERRRHRGRVGVVGVVDHRDAGRQPLDLHAHAGRLERLERAPRGVERRPREARPAPRRRARC